MRDFAKIRKVVTDTLSSQFKRIRIIDVEVEEDMDTSGDKILIIDVIFEGSTDDLDPKKLAGIERQLRPKLDAIEETAFPLVSFISKAEFEREKRAS